MPAATVIVPSRNRPAELHRCLRALQDQETTVHFEVVVVDDGSRPAVDCCESVRPHDRPVITIRCEGVGPARARNAGVQHARGSVILFTDDDTVPTSQWVNAACCFLADHPDHVGVEGPTVSPPYDPLHFHSVRASEPGSFLTCNVCYRRAAIDEVGGFSEIFPFPHGEDLDLGFRIARLGPMGFNSRMTVAHPPMSTTLISEVRRGRLLVSNVHLFRRHPELYPWTRYVPASGYALYLNAKHWVYSTLRDQYHVGLSPRRALRFAALATGHSALATFAVARDSYGRARTKRAAPQQSRSRDPDGRPAASQR